MYFRLGYISVHDFDALQLTSITIIDLQYGKFDLILNRYVPRLLSSLCHPLCAYLPN